jgi:hypothetical protein
MLYNVIVYALMESPVRSVSSQQVEAPSLADALIEAHGLTPILDGHPIISAPTRAAWVNDDLYYLVEEA